MGATAPKTPFTCPSCVICVYPVTRGGEQVGSGIEFCPGSLLRRHVGDRSPRGAKARHMDVANYRRHITQRPRREVCGSQFGQSEVKDFGVSASSDEDVGRLDVTVDNAL